MKDLKKRAIYIFRQSISCIYWKLIGVIHYLAGTKLYERKWKIKTMAKDVVMTDIDHPHRLWLSEQFNSLRPFSSILEIGCGYGLNIEILAKKFTSTSIVGLDINPVAVYEGEARLSQLGLKHAHIILGKADDLSKFSNKSIDVVFTDATLLYIGPDKILQVIAEMRRISRKALLLVEFYCSDCSCKFMKFGFHTRDGWVRDYLKILSHFFNKDSIQITKISTDIWPTGRWSKYGHLIKVVF